jgi:hypothetical protein
MYNDIYFNNKTNLITGEVSFIGRISSYNVESLS